ncbi:hypothetical protein GCM10009740_22870 [Terrabacter terrae]|uniref:Uncharacterized protein n=1 Tax=Terrabacter terrae TaxID=318434 RepID=A0ABP5FR64_9MICO
MTIWVELRRRDSSPVRDVADPSGGTFDAAGDFDRFIGRPTLPVLGAIDPYADTSIASVEMPGLLRDIELSLDDAKDGPEMRGLLRLRALAGLCRDDASTYLIFGGD